jgi:hypothetical protein
MPPSDRSPLAGLPDHVQRVRAARGDEMRLYIGWRMYVRRRGEARGQLIALRGFSIRIQGYDPPDAYAAVLRGFGVDPWTIAARTEAARADWERTLALMAERRPGTPGSRRHPFGSFRIERPTPRRRRRTRP